MFDRIPTSRNTACTHRPMILMATFRPEPRRVVEMERTASVRTIGAYALIMAGWVSGYRKLLFLIKEINLTANMTIKNVNWCGGFNRIFVLLCIGWVVFVL